MLFNASISLTLSCFGTDDRGVCDAKRHEKVVLKWQKYLVFLSNFQITEASFLMCMTSFLKMQIINYTVLFIMACILSATQTHNVIHKYAHAIMYSRTYVDMCTYERVFRYGYSRPFTHVQHFSKPGNTLLSGCRVVWSCFVWSCLVLLRLKFW